MVRCRSVFAAVSAAAAVTAVLSIAETLPPVAVPHEEPPIDPVPPYVLPIASIHASGETFGTATAFVVDRDRGYIATAAHAVGDSVKFLVFLPDGIWLPVYAVDSKDEADVALLRVPEGLEPFLPEAPVISDQPLIPADIQVAVGYKLVDRTASRFAPVRRLLTVLRLDTNLCDLSEKSCRRLQAVLQYAQLTGYIPRRAQSLFYDRYVQMLDPLADGIPHGLSGGPTLDRHDHVTGVVSMSNVYAILVVPIDEVLDLMQ